MQMDDQARNPKGVKGGGAGLDIRYTLIAGLFWVFIETMCRFDHLCAPKCVCVPCLRWPAREWGVGDSEVTDGVRLTSE